MALTITALALALLAGTVVQASLPSDTHYVAAVVDFAPPFKTELSAEENMLANVRTAGTFIANASAKDADIIVFPEMGLQGLDNDAFYSQVPDPDDHISPCLNSTYNSTTYNATSVMRELSCLSIKYKIYLVVNLPETFACNSSDVKCPSIGAYHYNTNVVFNRSGGVVARYRKWNLFGESGTQKPPSVEYVTFETDFGVVFGTFICFDILFEKPAELLVREYGVTDVVFGSAWFSEVPFLTAVQTQAMWAHAMDANFLAAGYHYPATGSGGSGIYRGRNGPIMTTFTGVNGSTMLVERVPKRGHWPEGDASLDPTAINPELAYAAGDPYDEMKAVTMKHDNLSVYTTELLDRPAPGEEINVQSTLCSNISLCCDFHITGRGFNIMPATSAATGLHSSAVLHRYLFSSSDQTFNLTAARQNFTGFYYRLAVFQGVRDHSGVATTGIQVCGLMSCLNQELSSCGYIADDVSSPSVLWTEFHNISISGEFSKGRLYMPDTQTGPRYQALLPSRYVWDHQADLEGNHFIHMHLQGSVTDLRTFAIYGRVFDWDGESATGA